jgi:hypothetical protein
VEATFQVAPNRSKLAEPSPKVKLSQDRIPIVPPHLILMQDSIAMRNYEGLQ